MAGLTVFFGTGITVVPLGSCGLVYSVLLGCLLKECFKESVLHFSLQLTLTFSSPRDVFIIGSVQLHSFAELSPSVLSFQPHPTSGDPPSAYHCISAGAAGTVRSTRTRSLSSLLTTITRTL